MKQRLMAVFAFSATSRPPLRVLPLFLLPFLVQGCLFGTQYSVNPRIQYGAYVDIWNFSHSEINSKEVDELYLLVAHLLSIIPDRSIPHPQMLLVSPSYIQQQYLRFRPSATTEGGVATALYIPFKNQILIPYNDRSLLIHELAHYFAYHYPLAPRFKWEEIADMTVDNGKDFTVKRLSPAALFLP